MSLLDRLHQLDGTERGFDSGAFLFRRSDGASVLHHGGLREAVLDGKTMGIQDLAARGKVWAFNGLAEMPEEPLFTVRRRETVLLTMINDTAWPHGMHLHGHYFRAVASDGVAGPFRDTVLMDREETVRIAFVADNPGDRLLHCHMLEHSVGGMMTWIRVT